jgi:nitrite reductase/ring-hydroxylating ferredoxin subunit
MSWTSLCHLSELEEGKGKYVEIDGFQLAVFLDEGRPYVMDNTCPHAGGNLAGGFIEKGCAVCPWHYWTFHLDSGQLRDAPGVVVKTYPVRITQHEKGALVQADLPMY